MVSGCCSVAFGVSVVCRVVVGVVVVACVGVGIISVPMFVSSLLEHIVHLLDIRWHPPGTYTVIVDVE